MPVWEKLPPNFLSMLMENVVCVFTPENAE